VTDHAHARIGRQHALETARRAWRAVSDDDHPGVQRVADADPTAVMKRHPRRARSGVDERVEDRPIGDRVGAVLHGFGLAIR
jgi:hypothetical protein